VAVESLLVTARHRNPDEPGGHDPAENWHVDVGVNGVWHVRQLTVLARDIPVRKALDIVVDLEVHPDDEIKITACGFEADVLFHLLGAR
jgi:hypothetical protein